MIYIRLFHGRADPNKDMEDWGSEGPVFGPYAFEQITYALNMRLIKSDGNCDQLICFEDMLYYQGVYYGDWSILDAVAFKKSDFKVTIFEPEKEFFKN